MLKGLEIKGFWKTGHGYSESDTLKADIENSFRPKTASPILKLREVFPGQKMCGRVVAEH